MTSSLHADAQKIVDELRQEEHYQHLKILDDGTVVGTGQLMFTCALYIGLNPYGWERRYCYPNQDMAVDALGELKNGDEEPKAGFVAQRPEPPGRKCSM